MDWEESFSRHTSEKAVIGRMNKVLPQTKKKKGNIQFQKWAKELNRLVTRRGWSNVPQAGEKRPIVDYSGKTDGNHGVTLRPQDHCYR